MIRLKHNQAYAPRHNPVGVGGRRSSASTLLRVASACVLLPLIATSVLAQDGTGTEAAAPTGGDLSADQSFSFDWQELGSLQFSRSSRDSAPVSELQTELSFKLSPGRFDFSPQGAFGLGGFFANPEVAVSSRPSGRYKVQESVPELHDGLSYSAGIKIEHEDQDISGTAYVSSSQLGVSYGRLGRVWYGGVDVTIGQFQSDSPINDATEVLSFDLTTGRRMSWTGVGPNDPLWLLSLQGNFDVQQQVESGSAVASDWYLNPSLFWQNRDFTFAAQLQVPVDSGLLRDSVEPDYRLRAVFEKQFR